MKAILLFTLCICFTICSSQEIDTITSNNNLYNKYRFLVHGGIGYGNIKNESAPNYNLNLNYFEALFNYRFSEKYGIATGIGINELTGNGFNVNGNFYHEREEVRIPLLATADYNFNDRIKAIVGLGFYGKTNRTDDFRFLNTVEKDVYEGWSFGFQGNFGLVFEFSKHYSFGLNFNTQSDFIDYEARPGQFLSGEQRMKNVSALGVLVLMQF